ncbi:hypothetical protein COOONC_25148, partial [Cooperia oncophora]
ILLATNACNHCICLLSEIVNAVFILSDQPFTRRTCYSFIALYIFAMCQQAAITLMISIDLWVALVFPIWYRMQPIKPYISLSIVLCTCYSIPIAAWGWMAQDDELIPFCNPPLEGRDSVVDPDSTDHIKAVGIKKPDDSAREAYRSPLIEVTDESSLNEVLR